MKNKIWSINFAITILTLVCSTVWAQEDYALNPLSNEAAEAMLAPSVHKGELEEPEDCQALRTTQPDSKEYEIHEVGCSVFKALNTETNRCAFKPMPSGSFKIALAISIRGESTVAIHNIDLNDLKIAECYANAIQTIKWKPRPRPFGPHETVFQINGWPKD